MCMLSLFFSIDEYTLHNYLSPKLSPSCLGYRDLFFDPVADKVRAVLSGKLLKTGMIN